MVKSKSKRIFYFDALRAAAILCVVLLHVTGHLGEMMNYNVSTIYSLSGAFEIFTNNFFRIGIALFLMISGALLLGRDWDIKSFFSRRIPRVVKPFVFWSLIFSMILISASYFIADVNFVSQSGILGMLTLFVDMMICKAPGSEVYWFFWMMLAVYLMMPIFNKWLNNTDMSKVEYFLIVWTVYIVAAYSFMLPIPEILSFFICPIGFVVLGYYLRHTERKLFNNSIFAAVLIIIPAVFMMIYSYAMVDAEILFVFHRYSILIMIEAVGVFCLFKTSSFLNHPGNGVKKVVSSIAVCSYGMYLIHSQMIMVTRKILHLSLGFSLDYLVLFIVGFVFSWIIIYILSRIPVIGSFVGVE
jgi:surface polysaccharide O-acyltransferase-like enzyme